MHGNLTGAYDIPNVSVRNRVVMTNKTPTGLNRGFGGPQVYYALERLMQRVAVELEPRSARRDPAQSRAERRVSVSHRDRRPARLRRLSGLRRAGDATRAVLPNCARGRTAARAEGRLYGIGLTAVVEPSVSNMGYITTVLTPEERRKAGPKNGAQATATIALDPGGAVSVHVSSVPQGQGHRTVASQIVADALGLKPIRHPHRHRHGHGARRLVDRVGQLREPLRAGGLRRRAACGRAAEGQACARRRGAAQCAGRRDRVRARARAARAAIPTTRCRSAGSPPRRTGRPARCAGGRSNAARDGVLDAAATDRADRG